MRPAIFPKEVIRFSLENYYFRFSRSSTVIYLLIAGVVIAFFVALPFVKVDITVQSRGIIRSRVEITSIQTPVTGQVQEINLRENMKVMPGDTLIRLAPDKILDQLSILNYRIELYGGYLHDLETLVAGAGKGLQSDLWRSSFAEYTQKLNEYQLRIETARKDFKRTTLLFEKDVIASAEFDQKELEMNQLLKEYDYYISQKKAEWHQQLFKYQTELQTLIDNRDQLKFEKRFYVVVAPVSGYVSNFTGVQIGSFIFPNQVIATISPADSLIAECYVSPNDIGYLRNEMPVSFQIDAYNYNQWGLASGRIIDISNHPYQENETVYFKVRCKLDQDHLSLKSGYEGKLKNGLTLTARCMVTRRSLFNLLFDKTDDWLNPKIITDVN